MAALPPDTYKVSTINRAPESPKKVIAVKCPRVCGKIVFLQNEWKNAIRRYAENYYKEVQTGITRRN